MPGAPESEWLFVTEDPEGRHVGLKRETFEHHIQPLHPGVSPEAIKSTIETPDLITENDVHGSVNYVASVPGRRQFFRLVAARRRDDEEGKEPRYVVCTAFPRSTPPSGRILWQRPTTP